MFLSRRCLLRKKPKSTLAERIASAMKTPEKATTTAQTKTVADQEKAYDQLNKITTKNVIPELRAPTKFDPKNYPVPKFNPKRDKISTKASDLIKYEKIDSDLAWPLPIWTIDKIVNFLKEHRLSDICVIRSDPTRGQSDYLVIASGLSRRHISIVGEELHVQFKRDLRDAYLEDNFVRFEMKGLGLGPEEKEELEHVPSFDDQQGRGQSILKHLEDRATIEGARGQSDWVCVNTLSATIHLLTDFSRSNLCLEELHLLNHHDPFSQQSMLSDREQQEEINKKIFKLTESSTDPDEIYDSLADEYMTDKGRYDEEQLQSSYATNTELEDSMMASGNPNLNYDSQDIEAIRQEILEQFEIDSEDYRQADMVKDFDLLGDRDHRGNLELMDDFLNRQEGQKSVSDYASSDKDNYFSYKIEAIESLKEADESKLSEADRFLLRKMRTEDDTKTKEESAQRLLDDL